MRTSSKQVVCWVWWCLLICGYAHAATVGDGQTSLITGRAIDVSSTRDRCYLDGGYYQSETSIPRQHPCHYCLCYQTRIDCYWKSCGPPPTGCSPLLIDGVCSPSLYVCSIPERARNAPDYGRRQQSSFPQNNLQSDSFPHVRLQRSVDARLKMRLPVEEPFPVKFDTDLVRRLDETARKKRSVGWVAGSRGQQQHHDHHNHDHHEPQETQRQQLVDDRGCTILGVRYALGELIGVATDVCMECRCAAQTMYCSPKCCFEPVGTDLGQQFLQRADFGEDRPAGPHPLYYVRTEFDYDAI